jgi:hypothetical protein
MLYHNKKGNSFDSKIFSTFDDFLNLFTFQKIDNENTYNII